MLPGFATPAATAAFAARFPDFKEFYRKALTLTVSSLGLGSYLGPMTDEADAAYTQAVRTAIESGINCIDTSLNYRNQRSERNIGAALQSAAVDRHGLLICTKAGYLVSDALTKGALTAEDVVGNMHSMAPAFLEDQLDRSRENLGIETVDVFYLHNPETQLDFVDEDEFYTRVRTAFVKLEELGEQGKLCFYGAATWGGFRQSEGGLSLLRMADIAEEVAGEGHRFRFIQLPLNLAMTEALSNRDEDGRNVLDHAAEQDITVIASASILQGRLSKGLPPVIVDRMRDITTDAQRAIQFTRSTPGVTVALTGMGRKAHVVENMGLTGFPPLNTEEFLALFQ